MRPLLLRLDGGVACSGAHPPLQLWCACLLHTQNVVLSGGNSLFRKLASRLERDIKGRVDKRLRANAERLAKSLGRKVRARGTVWCVCLGNVAGGL